MVAYDNGEETTIPYCDLTKTFRRYVQTVEAGGVRNPLGTYADLMDAYNNPIDLGDNATATIVCSSGWVAENPNRIAGTVGTSSLAVNSRSVGVYIQYKGFDYLVAGDLTGNDSPSMEQAIRDLLVSICDSPTDDPIDVLRINHHGSDSSSEQSYLNDLKPEVVIMSLGDGNSYEHPKQEVIDRLYSIYLQPLTHIYLTEEGEPGRDYYQIPHDFLYDSVVILTDGKSYQITNSTGGFNKYQVDSLTFCEGDSEPDGDVDGYDLALFASGGAGVALEIIASNYGRTDCPPIPVTLTWADPSGGQTLLAGKDIDGNPDNDLQMEVSLQTDAPSGAMVDLQADGTPLSGSPLLVDELGLAAGLVTIPQGLIELQAEISDAAYQLQSSIIVLVDVLPPTISIEEPVILEDADPFQPGLQLDLDVVTTYAETGQPISVTSSLTGGGVGMLPVAEVTSPDVPVMTTIRITIPPGDQQLTALVTDENGNGVVSDPVFIDFGS